MTLQEELQNKLHACEDYLKTEEDEEALHELEEKLAEVESFMERVKKEEP